MEEEEKREEREGEVVGEVREEEEGEGEDEEEEEECGGLEGCEAVDGGGAFDEWVGVGGEEELVDDGDEEGEDCDVELEVAEARVVGEWVVGFRGVGVRGFQVVAGG